MKNHYKFTVDAGAVKNTHHIRTDGSFMQCPALRREVHTAAGILQWAQAYPQQHSGFNGSCSIGTDSTRLPPPLPSQTCLFHWQAEQRGFVPLPSSVAPVGSGHSPLNTPLSLAMWVLGCFYV